MRLLNIHTFEFGEFFEGRRPSYVIFSHRWSDEEVSYKDFRKGRNTESLGYRKIIDFCKFVRDNQRRISLAIETGSVDWVWIDTW